MTNKDYLTAIVFLEKTAAPGYALPKKYRNIINEKHVLQRFYNFIRRKFPTVHYINFYWKENGAYYMRHYFSDTRTTTQL